MLQLQEAIKRIIDRYISQIIPLLTSASAGDTTIYMVSTRRFKIDDKIVVYYRPNDSDEQAEGEVHTVTCVPTRTSLIIDSPLLQNYNLSNSYVQKILGYESGNEHFLDGSYLGDPDVIPRYPAITIDAKSDNSDWFTLESTTTEYNIDITVYVTSADYESQYRLMHYYIKAIKDSLFRSFYPLVEPYDYTTLTNDVAAESNLIQLDDADTLRCLNGWIWLENYDFLRANRVSNSLGNGIYEMQFAAGRDFSAGDKVIRPRRHFYDTLPYSTTYGTVNKGTMLKAGRISYRAKEENLRRTPYIDPLTF